MLPLLFVCFFSASAIAVPRFNEAAVSRPKKTSVLLTMKLRERYDEYNREVTSSPIEDQPRWSVVWFTAREWEADWIDRVLLSGLTSPIARTVDDCAENMAMCVTPGIAIVVGRLAEKKQDELYALLHAAQRANSTVIAIHISDEQCDLSANWYSLVALVLRQYWCEPQSLGEHVVTIPCGVKTGWNYTHGMLSASERKCPWSFYGNIGGIRSDVRMDMGKELDKVPGGCTHQLSEGWEADKSVQGATYTDKMCNTIIAPCPRGFGFETFRFNEALECGSIPIVDDGGKLFHNYMPGLRNVVITTDTRWEYTTEGERVSDVVKRLLADPVALERRRLATMAWYHRYRRRLLHRVQMIIDRVQ